MERGLQEHLVHFLVGETEVQKGTRGLPRVLEKVSGRVRLRYGPVVPAGRSRSQPLLLIAQVQRVRALSVCKVKTLRIMLESRSPLTPQR